MEAVKAAGTARSARTSGTSGGRRRRPPPAPLVPAIAGTVPEQDGAEYIGGIDHPVIPLTVAGVAQGVQDGGDHHQDDNQGDHANDGVSSAVVGRAAFAEIAQAVLVHVEFIDAGEQLDHAVAELARHGVLIEVLIHVGGYLAVGHGVVGTYRQVALAVAGVDDQDAVGGSQLDLDAQVVSVVVDLAVNGGAGGHGDEAVIPLDPVGVEETDLLLLLVGEYVCLVVDPLGVGRRGQGGIQSGRLGGLLHGVRSLGPPLANAHRGDDHHQGQHHRDPSLLKKFHIGFLSHMGLRCVLGLYACFNHGVPAASASARPRCGPARPRPPCASGCPRSGSS